jgi:hypothetical protein
MKKPSMKPVAKAAGPAKEAVKTTATTKAKASTPKAVSSPANYAAEDKKWRAEDAMRTLMRAEDIKKDRALMSDVQRMAKEQAAKMSGLCGKGSK